MKKILIILIAALFIQIPAGAAPEIIYFINAPFNSDTVLTTSAIPANNLKDFNINTAAAPLRVESGQLYFDKATSSVEATASRDFNSAPIKGGKLTVEYDIKLNMLAESGTYNNNMTISLYSGNDSSSGMTVWAETQLSYNAIRFRNKDAARAVILSSPNPAATYSVKAVYDLDNLAATISINGSENILTASTGSMHSEFAEYGVKYLKIMMAGTARGEVWVDNFKIYKTGLDKDALTDKIYDAQTLHDDAAEGTLVGQYPTGSKSILLTAITTATGVLNNASSTQIQLDSAVTTLQTAMTAFENQKIKPLDKSELFTALNEANSKHNAAVEGTSIGNYETGSKAIFKAVIDIAQAAYDSGTITQTQVENAKNALLDAIEAFENAKIKPADKSGLLAELNGANSKYNAAVDGYNYENGARAELKIAIDAAQLVYDNSDAIQSEINSATSALTSAIVEFESKKIVRYDENFDSSTTLPSGYTKSGSGTVEIAKGMDGAYGNVLKLAQEEGQSGTNLTYTLPDIYTGTVLIEYRMRADIYSPDGGTTASAAEIMFRSTGNQNTSSVKIEEAGKRIADRVGGSNRWEIAQPNYTKDKWYYHRVLIDFDNRNAIVHNNDFVSLPGAIDPAIINNLNVSRILINAPTRGTLYIDDIKITNVTKPSVKKISLEDNTDIKAGIIYPDTKTLKLYFDGGLDQTAVSTDTVAVTKNGLPISYIGSYDNIFNYYKIVLLAPSQEGEIYKINIGNLISEFGFENRNIPEITLNTAPHLLKINSLSFDKASVSAISDSISAVCDVTNNDINSQNVNVFIVCYQNGIYKGMKVYSDVILAGETKDVTVTYFGITNKQGLTFETFASKDDISKLMTITPGKELK